LGDQRNDEESNFNSGDGTGQMAQPWMFMMMMIIEQTTKILRPATVSSLVKLSIKFKDYECVEIYLHSLICLYGVVLTGSTGTTLIKSYDKTTRV
jgi:hypothetical protein